MHIFFALFLVFTVNLFAEMEHQFLFFYKEQNDKMAKQQEVFDHAMQSLGEKAKSTKVNVKDPSQQGIVDRFNLKRAPMPFVIVLAPNGAIVGGFTVFDEEQLVNSITSPGGAAALKALQDHKLLILTLQNSETIGNKEALIGINEFKADPRFSAATVVVKIDPSDPGEQKFLNQLKVDANPKQATTLLIAPPAQIIGKYQGATRKEQMVADVQSGCSNCCSDGCCPGGCCPGGKCCGN